ncbi:hypothetical protein O3M35_009615 [Rhynocoris fuscipes]|uniref:Protein FAM136A n=1 Tax=Rhynocoris fuscipes TaxID=488301 RepID=A0AAW1D3L7_9HEMI
MVDQQSRKIEDAMKKIVNEIDTDYLRKMQANMHRCAARCCDNSTDSMEQVHRCVQNCSASLTEAENFVKQEFNTVQNRLQRCIMECNDEIRDKAGPSPTDSDMNRYTAEFEKCATKCVDKHIEQLPAMLKRMKEVLKNKQQSSALYYPSS